MTAIASVAPHAESTTDEWVTAPQLSEMDFSGSFWCLSNDAGRQLSPFLVLAPGGLVGGFKSASASLWMLVKGYLCIVGDGGLPSAVFTAARVKDGKIVSLAGRGNIDGHSGLFTLTVTQHPQHPTFASPPHIERRANFLVQPEAGPLRPNLVILPAGKGSLHPNWFNDVTAATRNWDLCLGYYGTETPEISTPFEYLAHIPATKKFRLLYDLLHEGSPLWAYEAIWLPDDDLDGTGTDINRMFHVFRMHGLDLAQPSLKGGPGSFPNHPITVQRPNSVIRHERFVEIMCPLFSKRALKICVGSMKDVSSGYGLDHLWPSFLGHPTNRMGIIDAASFAHTRPIGATYDVRSAIEEQRQLFGAYRFNYQAIAGVR